LCPLFYKFQNYNTMKYIFSAFLFLFGIHFAVAQSFSIAGIVALEDGRGIPNATVTLIDNTNSDTLTTTTDSNGGYSFLNRPAGNSFQVSVSKDGNPYNGTSTFDLVLLSKHILQQAVIESPYKILAGDVNQSGSVSTQDIVYMAALILARQTAGPDGTVWRFIPANHNFPNVNNPFGATIPSVFAIPNLSENQFINFVGVKIGDISGDALLE